MSLSVSVVSRRVLNIHRLMHHSIDPIALGIPAYFDVIKRPMDLSTIANKITHEQYNDVTGVDKDIRLMIKNCFTFNPPGTPVHVCGEELQGIWNGMWKGILAVADFEEDDEDPALNRGESGNELWLKTLEELT
jgi:hypothetical protein